MKVAKKKKLNLRQQKFIVEYCRCGNGAEAARRAGYSPKTARDAAHQLLTNTNIREALDEALKSLLVSPDDILAELQAIAKANIKDLWDGNRMMMPGEIPFEITRLFKKFTATATRGVEIEMFDKIAALGLLGKFYRLFVDRKEISGQITMDQVRKILDDLDEEEE